MITLMEKVMGKVEVTPTGCWEWQGGCTKDGYGGVWWQGRQRYVHHVTHDAVHGAPAPGMDRGHRCHDADADCPGGRSCRHRRCCNPSHLEAQTRAENLAAGRAR